MAHEVKFTVPARPLGNADIEFSVFAGGGKLGELHISRGALVWVPKDHTYGLKISWSEFDGLMKKFGKNGRK